MKTLKRILLAILVSQVVVAANGQSSKKVEGPRWRIGLQIGMASNFKNVKINYPSLGYTGALGGFTGKGAEFFVGYKVHKYVAIDLAVGALFNSYNRNYSGGYFIQGRFNKYYAHPSVKFIYPIINGDYRTVNLYLGGGIGVNGCGRFYLQEDDSYTKYTTYARFDQPMIAPFAVVGAELLFGDQSNIVVGFKYQNGTYDANQYYESDNVLANLKTAPPEIKTLNAQGLALMIGFIQLF